MGQAKASSLSGEGSIRGSLQGPKSFFLSDQGALEPHSVGPSFSKSSEDSWEG